jgi:hypothetical protein
LQTQGYWFRRQIHAHPAYLTTFLTRNNNFCRAQGVDTSGDDPQLIYACAGIAAPDTPPLSSMQLPSATDTDQTDTQASSLAASAGAQDTAGAIPWAASSAAAPSQAVTPGQMRITPGENLNMVSPITADPAATLSNVWSLSSRKLAPLKIW